MNHESSSHSEAPTPNEDAAGKRELQVRIVDHLAMPDDVGIVFEPKKLDIELRPADLG